MQKKIRVIETPKGAAPYNRRAQLVGLEVPLSEEQKEPERAFNVTRQDAVAALRSKSQEVADWWDTYLSGLEVSLLAFARGVCVLIPDEPATAPRHRIAAMTAANRR